MKKEILERYNIITGQTYEVVDLKRLSSAQRARFISWLRENNLSLEDDDLVNSDVNRKEVVPNTIGHIERDIEICGIGIDIQFVPQLFSEDLKDIKSNRELLGIFSLNEIAFAETKKEPTLSLAGIFCAKEALIKAGYDGEGTKDLRKLEISHDKNGKPYFLGYSVSISHSKDFALATAVRLEAPDHYEPSPTTLNHVAELREKQTMEATLKDDKKGFSKITTILLVLMISSVVSNIGFVFQLLQK